MKKLNLFIALLLLMPICSIAQNHIVPKSVFTTKVIQLYEYDQVNGRMVTSTVGNIRIEKRFYEKNTRMLGGFDGYVYGFPYKYQYELIAYKNNEVWVNLMSGCGLGRSDIEGYQYSICVPINRALYTFYVKSI